MSEMTVEEFQEKVEEMAEVRSDVLNWIHSYTDLYEKDIAPKDCPLNYDNQHKSNAKMLAGLGNYKLACPICGEEF